MATSNGTTPAPLLADHVDKLPTHVNSVMIQIGKLFRHQANPEQRTISMPKTQAHEAMIKATRQYHETLDEIEIELRDAKAVLERDLDRLRARQAEREQALRAMAIVSEPQKEAQDVIMEEPHDQINIDPVSNGTTDTSMEQTDRNATSTNENINGPQTDEQGQQQEIDNIHRLSVDDLFGDDEFGPVDDNANYDFGNDLDFSSIPMSTTVTATSDPASKIIEAPATTQSASMPGNNSAEIQADTDALMQDFGEMNTTNGLNTNDFGDDVFGSLDQTQDGSLTTYEDPFKTTEDGTTDDFDFWVNDV